MKNLIQAAVVTLFAASTAQAQQAVQWRVQDGGNGHWYAIKTWNQKTSWEAAKLHAQSVGGHLATITSANEDTWTTVLTMGWTGAWFGLSGPYIGAAATAVCPDGNACFTWVTGEPFEYSRWHPGNPDNVTNAGAQGPVGVLLWEPNWTRAWQDSSQGDPAWYGDHRSAMIEWSADCNGDGIVDYGQCRNGTLPDYNGNNIPDCCENGASCASDPLDTGLQAYLKFDGDCADSSLFGRNGVPTGIEFVRDRFNALGKAARFDGVAADVQVQGIPIPSNNAFSWSLWLRIEPMPYGISGVPILQRIESVGNNLMSPSLWLRADGRLSFVSYLIGPGGWDLDTPPQAVTPGNWVHVACTSAASGDRRIYLNGALFAQGTAPNYGQELGLLLVGRDRLDSNPRLRAAVDELRIYDRTLSPSEVLAVRDVVGTAVPTCRDADIYRDFNVNGADLGILLSQWGPNTPLTESDLNRDGAVDGVDLGILLSFWGPCP